MDTYIHTHTHIYIYIYIYIYKSQPSMVSHQPSAIASHRWCLAKKSVPYIYTTEAVDQVYQATGDFIE